MSSKFRPGSKALATAVCLFGLGTGVAFAGGAVTLPDGVVGTPYNVDLTSAIDNGWNTNITGLAGWSVTGLPPGESVSADPVTGDAWLSGTPTATGPYNFTFVLQGEGFTEYAGFSQSVDPGQTIGPVSGVPEPATWALLLAGFFGISVVGVRRTSATRRLELVR